MLSPLFKLAVLSGAQPAVRFHIQRGIDVNSKDGDGRSPLMLAALKGDVEICRLLLEAGADPTLVDKDGRDALALALGNGRSGTGEVIREYLPPSDGYTEPVGPTPTTAAEEVEELELDSADEENLDVSKWEEEIESPAPAGDASCLFEAEAVQRNLTQHIPIDTAEDWSGVDITFPDLTSRRFREDFEEDARSLFRRLFLHGLRDGRVLRRELESLAPGNDWERADDFIERLLLVLGDLGGQVDEDPLPAEAVCTSDPSGDEYDGDSHWPQVDNAVTFMEDLNSAIGDPFTAYLKDIGSGQLLSREEEATLSKEMEDGWAEAVSAISKCEPAIAEILRVAEDICRGETPLEVMIDPDASNGGSVLNQNDATTIDDLVVSDGDEDEDNGSVSGSDAVGDLAIRVAAIRKLHRRTFTGATDNSSVLAALSDEVKSLHLSWKFTEHLCNIAKLEEREVETYERIKSGLAKAGRARGEFVKANLMLVIAIAMKYGKSGIFLSDLIQEGNIGLLKAVARFDYLRGFKFLFCGTWWICREITRAIANQARTIDRVDEDVFVGDLPIVHNVSSLDTLIIQERRAQIEDVLKTLPLREETIIRMRFGLDGGRECTLEEISQSFALTRERIRQIEVMALHKLRHRSRSDRLRLYRTLR